MTEHGVPGDTATPTISVVMMARGMCQGAPFRGPCQTCLDGAASFIARQQATRLLVELDRMNDERTQHGERHG